MMLLNIRGTGGSGKTTAALDLLGEGHTRHELLITSTDTKVKPPLATEQRVFYHSSVDGRVVALGKYERGKCGGTDGVKTQDIVCDALRAMVGFPDVELVIFEGLLASGLFQRYLDLSKEMEGREARLCPPYVTYVWAFMATTLEESIRRIGVRNGGKPFNPKHVESKHHSVQSCLRKATEAKQKIVLVNDSQELIKYLGEYGYAHNQRT